MTPSFCFISLLNLVALGELSIVYYPGTQTWHQTGQVLQTTSWYATVDNKANAFLTFGPYTNQSNNANGLCGPHHDLSVTFTLQIDNNDADNTQVARLDINDAKNCIILNTVDIYRTNFTTAQSPQEFKLSFINHNCSKSLEFRVFYVCCSEIIHLKTTLILDSSDDTSNPC